MIPVSAVIRRKATKAEIREEIARVHSASSVRIARDGLVTYVKSGKRYVVGAESEFYYIDGKILHFLGGRL